MPENFVGKQTRCKRLAYAETPEMSCGRTASNLSGQSLIAGAGCNQVATTRGSGAGRCETIVRVHGFDRSAKEVPVL